MGQCGRMTTHITTPSDGVEAVTALDGLRTAMPGIATTVLDELRSTATISVGRTAEILGISRGHAYNLVKSGDLPVIRLGAKRVRVPSAALLRMVIGEQ